MPVWGYHDMPTPRCHTNPIPEQRKSCHVMLRRISCHAIKMPVIMTLCNAHAKDIMPCQCAMTCQGQDVILIQCQNRENHVVWSWGYHAMPIQGYYADDIMPCQCQCQAVMPRTACHANGYHVKSMPSQGCHAITGNTESLSQHVLTLWQFKLNWKLFEAAF